MMRVLALLVLASAGHANAADENFAKARLRLKLRGQEVVDLLSHGQHGIRIDALHEEEDRSIEEEHAAVKEKEELLEALKAREASQLKNVRGLHGAGLLKKAAEEDAEAKKLQAEATALKAKLGGLNVARRSLNASTTSMSEQLAHTKNVTATLPAILNVSKTEAKVAVIALRKKAQDKLAKLFSKDKLAKTEHRNGEVAALRWEANDINRKFIADKAVAETHARQLATGLHVAQKQKPKLMHELRKETTQFKHVKAQIAKDDAKLDEEELSIHTLTAQAQLISIEGHSEMPIGLVLPNVTSAQAESKLEKIRKVISMEEEHVKHMQDLTSSDQQFMDKQKAADEEKAVDVSKGDSEVDASAISVALATDASSY